MRFMGSLLFNVCFVLITIFYSTIGLIYGTLKYDGVYQMAVWWAHTVSFVLKYLCGITYKIKGLEYIPKEGGYIFACKHQSTWETVMFQILSYRCAIILKQELLWIPIFGQVVRLTNAIGVNRRKGKSAMKDLIIKAREAVTNNHPIFIFPEGTRTVAGQVGHYKRGIAQLYNQLNIPVIPAALDSGYYWPRRGFIKYPGCITVQILAPIQPGLNIEEFMDHLSTTLEKACKNLSVASNSDILK